MIFSWLDNEKETLKDNPIIREPKQQMKTERIRSSHARHETSQLVYDHYGEMIKARCIGMQLGAVVERCM